MTVYVAPPAVQPTCEMCRRETFSPAFVLLLLDEGDGSLWGLHTLCRRCGEDFQPIPADGITLSTMPLVEYLELIMGYPRWMQP